MTPHEAATKTARPIGDLPGGFMLDGETYEEASKLGFEGIDFYFAGRGGALGAVDGSVVAAAFVFFNPETVCRSWDRAKEVMPPESSAALFASRCHRWALEHLADAAADGTTDYGRCSELLGRVTARASVAGAPLFAAWRGLPEPAEPKALTLHRLNALRELRGAFHGAAILSHGLEPLQALMVKTPFMAGIFGWEGELPEGDRYREQWEAAEASTNAMMGRVLSVLDEPELGELVGLLRGIRTD